MVDVYAKRILLETLRDIKSIEPVRSKRSFFSSQRDSTHCLVCFPLSTW